MEKKNASAFCAQEYDEKIEKTLPYYEEFYKQIVEILLASGKHEISWLDVGCGTGKMYEMVRGRIELKEFVFCDNSPQMLQISRNRFSGPGHSFLEKSVLDLRCSPIYDVITAVQINHYFKKKERKQSVQNCYRALKDGGLFFTFENFAPFEETGKQLFLQRWKNYQVQCGRNEEDVEKHLSRYGRDYYPITVTEHLELLKECGFCTVEIIWLSCMQIGVMGIK